MPHSRILGRARGGGIHRVSPWANADGVGLSALDLDHQILQIALGIFENEIFYATRVHTLDKAVSFLIHFTDQHFRREEQLMERLGYPGFDAHKTSHDIMRAWMDASLPEIGATRNPHFDDGVLAYLYDWWEGHAKNEDAGYASFIRHQLDDARRIVESLPKAVLPAFLATQTSF